MEDNNSYFIGTAGLASASFSWAWHSSAPACFYIITIWPTWPIASVCDQLASAREWMLRRVPSDWVDTATECPGDRVPSNQVPRNPVPRSTEGPMVPECLVTQNLSKSNWKVVASYCRPSSGAWKGNLVLKKILKCNWVKFCERWANKI